MFVYIALSAITLAALRLLYASFLDLAPDEAYYWQWSKTLSLNYFDHPPLIAWIIRLGTTAFSHTNAGVRVVCILLSSIGVFIVFEIGRIIGLNAHQALLASLFASFLPASATGAILATPDTPLAFFWLLTMLSLVKLSKDSSRLYWYVLFVSIGLALLAKYSTLLIFPVLIAACIASKRLRSDLKTPHPWLAFSIFGAIVLPFAIEETRAGFPSAAFQLSHLFGHIPVNTLSLAMATIPMRLVELIAGQIGLLTPPAAVWIGISLYKRKKDPQSLILVLGFSAPIIAAVLSAFFTHPEQNWASTGHPIAAIMVIFAILQRFSAKNEKDQRKRLYWCCGVLLFAFVTTIIIHIHAWRPFLGIDPKRDPVSRLHGFEGLKKLSDRVDNVEAVVCDNYGLAAEFSWQYRSKGIAAVGIDRPHKLNPGTWLLLDEQNDFGKANLNVSCEAINYIEQLELIRKDREIVRIVDVYLGKGCIDLLPKNHN